MQYNLSQSDQIQTRESTGLVKDIYDPSASVKEPLSAYNTMLDLIHRDTTLSTAYDIVVDFATHRGYDFTGATKTKRDSQRFLFDTKLNFKQVLPNLLYSMCYYGDGYLELRKNNSRTVNELWVLETTEMRIIYDIHGKVTEYMQRPFKTKGLTEAEVLEKEKANGIEFKADEVIHFRMKWIGSQVYSYNPNESIAVSASSKLYAGNYLMNIFLNMPPRYVAHLAGVSKSEGDKAKTEFRATKTNYKKVIAFTRSSEPNSKLQIQKIDAPYDKELIEIIKWLNNEILKVTRVPRSWVEESGSENRGVTEAEQRPFDVRIQAIHRNILEPTINNNLLPKLGTSKKPSGSDTKCLFRFNEISKKGEKEILENVGLLRNMGLKPKAMVRYLDERGILGLDETDFEVEQIKKSMELNPSRQRMDKSTSDMTQKRNEAGVSESSGKKMGIA